MGKFALIILACLLTGCAAKEPPRPADRVVIAVEVTASLDGELIHRQYENEDKIRTVLHYLRLLAPQRVTPMTPESFRTNAYRITLKMSDGSQVIYHQLHSDYLQKNSGPWKTVDSKVAAQLPKLLKELPGDSA